MCSFSMLTTHTNYICKYLMNLFRQRWSCIYILINYSSAVAAALAPIFIHLQINSLNIDKMKMAWSCEARHRSIPKTILTFLFSILELYICPIDWAKWILLCWPYVIILLRLRESMFSFSTECSTSAWWPSRGTLIQIHCIVGFWHVEVLVAISNRFQTELKTSSSIVLFFCQNQTALPARCHRHLHADCVVEKISLFI